MLYCRNPDCRMSVYDLKCAYCKPSKLSFADQLVDTVLTVLSASLALSILYLLLVQ